MGEAIIICGNMKVPCGYRDGKECNRPREFSCKQILDKFDKNGKLKQKQEKKELSEVQDG